jgi:hypothetical protein
MPLPSDPDRERYADGIWMAEEEGKISYWLKGRQVEKNPYNDVYDPADHLTGMNNRELTTEAREMLRLLAPASLARMLFIGAGSGRACAQAHDIAPDRFSIDTVGMSCIDPTLRLTAEHHVLRPLLTKFRDRYRGVASSKRRMNFNDLLAADRFAHEQHLDQAPFVERVLPYIRHQFVGKFPHDVQLPPVYTFVHDQFAAFLHDIDGEPTLEDAYAVLRPDGMVLIQPWCERFEGLVRTFSPKGCVFVLERKDNGGGGLIMAREESLIAQAVHGESGGENTVLEVESLSGFLARIPTAPAKDTANGDEEEKY